VRQYKSLRMCDNQDGASPTLLPPGGVLFGSTILADDIAPNRMARRFRAAYNRKGIFGNRDDSLEALQTALSHDFETWDVRARGCVTLFWGR
jgi:hypothetical protein